MNNYSSFRHIAQSLLLVVYCYPVAGFSALDGDSHWLVEKGDSVYSIARKVFPDDPVKQKQFRSELVKENPAVFKGDASRMNLGDRLLLPAFATSKPVPDEKPATVTEPVMPVAISENEATSKDVTPDPEEVIGHVVISVGTMQASNRGTFRELVRKSAILRGDTLTTSRASYTQLRMKDGALISLRPDTQLKFTDYRFNGKQDGSERSFMELVRGGFRTITGYIGHRNKQNYRVKTAVATIGIRGTHYGLLVCADGSCDGEDASLEDGVYGGVVDGSIVVENESGITTFNNDQYFYVASTNESPVEQLVPPPVFHGKNEKLLTRKDFAKGDAGKVKEKAMATAKQLLAEGRVSQKAVSGNRLGSLIQAYIDERRPPVIFRDQATNVIKDKPSINVAPIGTGALIAFSSINSADGTKDEIAAPILVGVADNAIALSLNNLVIGIFENGSGINKNELILPSGIKGITDVGGSDLGVRWGRWSDTYVFAENGVELPTFGNMHFIYSNNLTTPGQLDQLAALGGLTTSENYTLVGNTTPTNAAGQPVSLLGLNVTSDFVNQQIVDYQVAVRDNVSGTDFAMSATNVSFQNISDFNLTSVNCTGCSGSAAAAFVGKRAQGLMTSYSMRDTTGTEAVNGTAFLTRDSAAAAVVPLQ